LRIASHLFQAKNKMSESMATSGEIQDPQAEIDDESDYEDFEVGRNYALSGRLYFTCHSSRDMTSKMICENPMHFYFSNVGPEVRAPHAHTHTPSSPHERSRMSPCITLSRAFSFGAVVNLLFLFEQQDVVGLSLSRKSMPAAGS
jgi:hypothetical protein